MIANPHALPAPLADGTLGVFVPASLMVSTMSRLFGGPNRDKPISYDALYQQFARDAYRKDGPDVEQANQTPKTQEGPDLV